MGDWCYEAVKQYRKKAEEQGRVLSLLRRGCLGLHGL